MFKTLLYYWVLSILASLVAQAVKCLSAMQETWVRSLGWEDPLEKEMAAHSSILAWRIPWMEEPGGLQSMGSQRVGHDWATSLPFTLTKYFLFNDNNWTQYLKWKRVRVVFPITCFNYMCTNLNSLNHRSKGVDNIKFTNPTSKVKPVSPKGNQPWVFIGRTDAEAEVPILWPSDTKSQCVGKDPDAGKHWRQKDKGAAEHEKFG